MTGAQYFRFAGYKLSAEELNREAHGYTGIVPANRASMPTNSPVSAKICTAGQTSFGLP